MELRRDTISPRRASRKVRRNQPDDSIPSQSAEKRCTYDHFKILPQVGSVVSVSLLKGDSQVGILRFSDGPENIFGVRSL